MKKTNKKLMALLITVIVVVATFMVFEIPAFAQEMDMHEENIEMTVENENETETQEQVTETVDNEENNEEQEIEFEDEENTEEQEIEAENIIEAEFDFTPVTDFKLTWVQDIDTFLVNEKRAIIV